MSVEATKTPNGASKDLYGRNTDINQLELDAMNVFELDPEIDKTKDILGGNTLAQDHVIINNSTAIRDYGSVIIGATLVGQPVKAGPETKATVKASMEKVKNELINRGALGYDAYIKAKMKKADNKNKRAERQEIDQDQK